MLLLPNLHQPEEDQYGYKFLHIQEQYKNIYREQIEYNKKKKC